jgi:uncharacterized protein (UPF0335 family)
MTDNVGAEQLRQYVERAERVMAEIAELKEDLKGVFAEAKSTGFDTKTMKTIIKLRAMTPDQRREQEALLDTYKAALGMLDGTPLGNWAIERLTKKPPASSPVDDVPPNDIGDQPSAPSVEVAPAEPVEAPLTVEDARQLGAEAASVGAPVTSNPFPARDPRRAAWDEAWCQALGSDGMDIPDALKPTPKPKKASPADEPKGGAQ